MLIQSIACGEGTYVPTLLSGCWNPFNPETKIKFAIPKSALTKVSIYEVLGREVSVIVNEELKTGIYSVSWNAENFPSGVYFYKIKSGEFTSAKKMILLK